MAEIKSTLDLVMEKTRNLVQSEEEKQRQRSLDMENKARGLVLRIQEGLVKPAELPPALESLYREEGPDFREVVIKVLAGQLSPGAENDIFIESLMAVAGDRYHGEIETMKNILREYIAGVVQAELLARREALDNLKEKGITGGAIVPRLKGDSKFISELTDLKREFTRRLDEVRSAL